MGVWNGMFRECVRGVYGGEEECVGECIWEYGSHVE